MLRSSLVFILLIQLTSSAFAQNPVDVVRKEFLTSNSTNILVASHRAVHHVLPENSIPAIEEAIRLGVDIIEIDVKVSKDGVPMLMHDGKIDRTTNGKGDLEVHNYEDLRQLRLVANGKITSEKIPTLEEALNAAKGRILVDLDLKTDKINEVIKVVQKTNTADITFFFDSDFSVLSKIDSASRDFMIMPRAYNLAMADSAIKLYNPEVIHIDEKTNSREVINLVKKSRARVWINALGKPDEIIRTGNVKLAVDPLIKNGANIIQTDEPEKLLKYLRSSGLHK